MSDIVKIFQSRGLKSVRVYEVHQHLNGNFIRKVFFSESPNKANDFIQEQMKIDVSRNTQAEFYTSTAKQPEYFIVVVENRYFRINGITFEVGGVYFDFKEIEKPYKENNTLSVETI
jgi:hypothetical protein